MSRSIKFKNNDYIDSTGVSHKRETLYSKLNSIDEKLEKHQIIAYNSNNFNVNVENLIKDFEESYNVGTKLSLSNGKVYVGQGVSKVRLNATAFCENMNYNNIGYMWFFIVKNGYEEVAGSIISGVVNYFQTVCITDIVIDVSEGDYFQLKYNNPNYETHSPTIRAGKGNTRLFVEVVE